MNQQKRYFSIIELSQETGVSENLLHYFIENEWIAPLDLPQEAKRLLDEEDLARIKFIRELQLDFGANDEAIPIILHLVDQLNYLHCKIRQGK